MKILKLLITVCFLYVSQSVSQVTEQWASRYNGPANGSDGSSSATVDAAGNVYITGYRTGANDKDYITIKYNPSGVVQWSASYNGPGNDKDWATAIAVDGAGNVYITGYSVGSGTGNDYATVKYNSSGIQQWAQRYNGPGNADDIAYSLASDVSGNVYVTGTSFGSGTGYDYATIKYNSSGIVQWVVRVDWPQSGDDAAYSLVLDASANVYITGPKEGNSGTQDYGVIKYNSVGVQQWAIGYNGTGNGEDISLSIAVDGSGNTYVTGGSEGAGTDLDVVIIKYNSAGIQQWVTRYDGPANGEDIAFCVKLDGAANVYVTGCREVAGGSNDFATAKYNSAGVFQWSSGYNGPGNSSDIAYSMDVDITGSVYVTGHSTGIGTNSDYATIKYNPSGAQQWVQIYNGPGNNSDIAYDVILGTNGSVYVTGTSPGIGTNDDIALIKYSQLVGIQPVNNLIPESFSIEQNYPNPFNPVTTIKYSLPVSQTVSIKVYDAAGRVAAILLDEFKPAGRYNIEFDGTDHSSGIYFYTIEAGLFRDTKKFVLVK
ncbi:MAG: T9SS type A sorting domain-containing protein [Ignavibacteria bacterium]|nr:T9SS type A sorting domain-containing protein [Ignavibacteria bacterium]